MCLNEVRRRHARALGRALGMPRYVAASRFGPYGNVVYTNQPVVAWRRHRFAGVARPHRRDAAIVTLASGLEVCAIHLGLAGDERTRHAGELLETLGTQSIVAGDVNEPPGGPVGELLGARYNDACPDGAPTFPASEPTARIDVVLVTPGIAITSCRVVATSASDHRAVVVDLG